MSWKIAIVVALVTAVLLGLLTAPVADVVTRKLKVSNMEGGRGYLVLFLILAALVGGVVVGLISTRLVGATVWAQFWKAQGLSVLIGAALVLGIAGIALLEEVKPPRLNGRLLALEIEVYVPADRAPKAARAVDHLRMSLYAQRKDNAYIPIDTAGTRMEEGLLVVRARAPLHSASAERMLSLQVDDSISYTLDMPLRAKPRAADLAWTERQPMRLSEVQGTAYTYTDVLARYRVVEREAE